MYELVNYFYGSAFQELYDDFARRVCNFHQTGRHHRFWVSNTGKLRVLMVRALQYPLSIYR